MENTALLVIDVQTAMVLDKPYAIDIVVENIKKLIVASRENHIEIVYVQHNGEPGDVLEPGTDGWKIYAEIAPDYNEKVFTKNYNSAFKETGLKEYLDGKGLKKLIITGMQTEYCIDTACKVAFEYGYELIIPEMTNTTYDNGNISAKDLVEYYNNRIFAGRFGEVEAVAAVIERIRA